MKLDTRRIGAYLSDPGASRATLLFGEDAGLVRERVRQLLVSVAGSVDDPFRTVVVPRDDLAALPGELASQCLIGGRRVVHVPDATDAALPLLMRALERPNDNFLLVEAGNLSSKSKLRRFFETAANVASIACYPLGQAEGSAAFAKLLQVRSVVLDRDASNWLASKLGQERAGLEADAERLALFVHPSGQASLSDVQAAFTDGATSSVEDLLYAAASGRVADTDRGFGVALQEGASPVGILVSAVGHMHRLHRCAVLIQSGMSSPDAADTLRPQIFSRRIPTFVGQLSLWSPAKAADAAASLAGAEFACKQTGAPGELLARRALVRVAMIARRSAGPNVTR